MGQDFGDAHGGMGGGEYTHWRSVRVGGERAWDGSQLRGAVLHI